MEIIKSNKGSRKLLYEGYGYTKKYETKSAVRWECSKRIGFDCKGTLNTDLSVTSVKSSTEHSHAADTFATEAMKVRAAIKESAKANRGKPGQIVKDKLALQKKEVIVAAGPIRLLKQTVQRAKKGVTPKNPSKCPKLGQRLLSTSAPNNEKIYELRTYSIHPKDFKFFMGLSTEQFHLRTKHSKLMGYWMSELGGINEVVHIWEYDSLGHRAQVRQNLAGDPEWIEKYFSKVLPVFIKQDNSVMKCLPGTSITSPPGKGVYELKSYVAHNAPLETLAQQLSQDNGNGGGSVLGTFHNVIGITNIGHQLWYYPDIDNILSQKPKEVSGDNSEKQIHWFFSRVMTPAPFSPMQ